MSTLAGWHELIFFRASPSKPDSAQVAKRAGRWRRGCAATAAINSAATARGQGEGKEDKRVRKERKQGREKSAPDVMFSVCSRGGDADDLDVGKCAGAEHAVAVAGHGSHRGKSPPHTMRLREPCRSYHPRRSRHRPAALPVRRNATEPRRGLGMRRASNAWDSSQCCID